MAPSWFSRSKESKEHSEAFSFESPASPIVGEPWHGQRARTPMSLPELSNFDISTGNFSDDLLEAESAVLSTRLKELKYERPLRHGGKSALDHGAIVECQRLYRSCPDGRQRFSCSGSVFSQFYSPTIDSMSTFFSEATSTSRTATDGTSDYEHLSPFATDGVGRDEKNSFLQVNDLSSNVLPANFRGSFFLYPDSDNVSEGSNTLTPDSIDTSFSSESISSAASSIFRRNETEAIEQTSLLHWPKKCALSEAHVMKPLHMAEVPSLQSYIDQKFTSISTERATTSCDSFSDCARGEFMEDIPTFISKMKLPEESRDRHQCRALNAIEHHDLPTSGYSGIDDYNISPIMDSMRLISSNANSRFTKSLHSKWEESNALIAVENPALMLCSKWRDERVQHQFPFSAQPNVGEQRQRHEIVSNDHKSTTNIRELKSSDSQQTGAPDHGTDLPTCGSLCEESRCHSRQRDAYTKKGRRERGSSFSAVLPENLQRVVGDSVALVKISYSPHEDFRKSIYEMIMDRDLEESPMEVEELLYCYLELNPPELHELIVEVFSEVWSSILMSIR
ncbi:hypothetical protein KP509_26G022300 [Ceratopteris richardii]|uniref:OVATE domain-containing protein n=1 Tax=Ceratopteris richardii TaxID=49495 RepID=A0A8T2RLH0_CERRI|nr:hypothetical protein KP509_26G022300 [Ceratopteris richardii]